MPFADFFAIAPATLLAGPAVGVMLVLCSIAFSRWLAGR